MKTVIYNCGCRTYEVTEQIEDDVVVPDEVKCGCKCILKRRRDLEDSPDQIRYKAEE